MNTIKISICEARVMQALRAGPMNTSGLLDRFPGGLRIARLIKIGCIENDATGYKLTELGRRLCPTRRSIEKAAYLPPANAASIKQITTKPTIKAEVAMPAHTNVAKQIRDIITETPGIEHKALVAKLTNNSTNAAEIKKADNMITYVLKQGGFKKCDDIIDNKPARLYYPDHDSLKHKEKAQQVVENAIQTLKQHHEAKTYGTDNIKAEATAVTTIIKEPAIEESLTTDAAADNKTSALDVQEGGDHYKLMKIQPVEYIMANGIGFAEGNVIKYVSRWKNKNGLEDLKKARHFLDILIEQETA